MSPSEAMPSIVITGAAGSIGGALVDAFRDLGRVVAVDIAPRVAELETEGVRSLCVDISEPAGADALVDLAGPGPYVLCNNAGARDRSALAGEVTEADWHRVLATNVTAPFLLCRRFLPLMVEGGGGTIVNIASLAGLRGGRSGAAYTASKFALVGLTMNIAVTYGHLGVRCNAICPGATERARDAYDDEMSAAYTTLRAAGGGDWKGPERGSPVGIASVARFLASPGSERINGAVLPVDDGAAAF